MRSSNSRAPLGVEDDPHAAPADDPVPVEHGLAGLSTDWSVPWSDLMMVLFILFVVLYCYERAERDVGGAFRQASVFPEATFSPPRLREPSLAAGPQRDVYRESRNLVREAELDDVDVVLQSDRSVKVSVRGATFFDLGKADLKPETRSFLQRLAQVLRDNDHAVQVIGHTDSFPISSAEFPTNWELSAVRATRVARFLIEQGPLRPERFTVVGHSMYRPSLPNTTPENKARNRRVEIVIARERPAPPAGETD